MSYFERMRMIAFIASWTALGMAAGLILVVTLQDVGVSTDFSSQKKTLRANQ